MPSQTWSVVGASVAGSGHVRKGRPCEDAHGYRTLADGTLLLAVADGAGSAPRAEEGSRLAVAAGLAALERRLEEQRPLEDFAWEDLLREALDNARAALLAEAGQASLDDFATTLLLASISESTLATLQVGDGAIVCRETGGVLRVLTPVKTEEFVNVTRFITGSGYQEDALCTVLLAADVDGLALFTDGLQYLAIEYPQNEAFAPFFRPLFSFAERAGGDATDLEATLRSEEVENRTDDDKTMLLAVRHAAP